jgi:hypothetical protein
MKESEELAFRDIGCILMQAYIADPRVPLHPTFLFQLRRKHSRFVHAQHDTGEPPRKACDTSFQLEEIVFAAARQFLASTSKITKKTNGPGALPLRVLKTHFDFGESVRCREIPCEKGEPA